MKEKLRTDILKIRNSMSEEDIKSKSAMIVQKLIHSKSYQNAKSILCYVNFGSEVITKDIIDFSILEGKKVSIPYCIKETKEMVACSFTSWENLSRSSYGILEPNKNNIKIIDRRTIDLIIVPGAVFDIHGNRIGYGAGYYDRYLHRVKEDICKIALAFSNQIVPKIPKGIYDIPVNYIITEENIIEC